jgi:hypothetical protein
MSISIIIPTYNRASILRRVLERYSAQSGDHQMMGLLVGHNYVERTIQNVLAETVSAAEQVLSRMIRVSPEAEGA